MFGLKYLKNLEKERNRNCLSVFQALICDHFDFERKGKSTAVEKQELSNKNNPRLSINTAETYLAKHYVASYCPLAIHLHTPQLLPERQTQVPTC